MADSECSRGEEDLIPCHDEEKHSDASLLYNKLCEELVVEILVRLPTRSAVQSKVVCKKWCSLISSPSFISHFLHLRRGRQVDSSLVLQLVYTRDSTHHLDFQIISGGSSLLRNIYGEGSFQLSYLPCLPNHLRLEGSSADLILCSYRVPTTLKTDYYVSNLLTRQWIALPPLPSKPDFMESLSIGFLCYDCKPPKFMVVRVFSDDSPLLSQFKVQLFSSEDFEWKTLVVSSPIPLIINSRPTTLVAYRGMLHWLPFDSDCIVVYDPRNNPYTFSRVIQLPVHPPFLFHVYGCFGVSQGHLRVALNPNDDILDVWELQDYDSGLWILVYKIHIQNLIHNKSGLCPPSVLSFHPENRDVIYLRKTNGAVLLNMKSRIIEGVYEIYKEAILKAFHLADQWWPTPVSSLH